MALSDPKGKAGGRRRTMVKREEGERLHRSERKRKEGRS